VEKPAAGMQPTASAPAAGGRAQSKKKRKKSDKKMELDDLKREVEMVSQSGLSRCHMIIAQ